VERRAEGKLADELWVGGVADIEVHHSGGVGHRCHFAVWTDVRRTVKPLRSFRLWLARLLSRHPPAACLLRMRPIADVEDHEDVRAEAGRRRGQIRVLAAWI